MLPKALRNPCSKRLPRSREVSPTPTLPPKGGEGSCAGSTCRGSLTLCRLPHGTEGVLEQLAAPDRTAREPSRACARALGYQSLSRWLSHNSPRGNRRRSTHELGGLCSGFFRVSRHRAASGKLSLCIGGTSSPRSGATSFAPTSIRRHANPLRGAVATGARLGGAAGRLEPPQG